MRAIHTAVLASLLILPTVPALAHVDPVSVGLMGEARAARAGELYTGTFFIESGVDMDLSDLRFEGVGYRPMSLKAPTARRLVRGDHVEVEFTVLTLDPEQPLTVAFEWNGRTYTKDLDLSEDHVRLLRDGHVIPTTNAPPADHLRSVGGRGSGPGPYAGVLASRIWETMKGQAKGVDVTTAEEEEAKTTASYDITVEGRFTYWREDNFHIGADAVTVEVYDFDWASPPDLLAATTTSIHGYYDMTFHWDSIDDPDLFVVIWAANSKVRIEDDTFPHEVYSWHTDVRHNFTGTYWNLGTGEPPEEHFAAVHIHNDVTRTWRWFDDYGYNCRSVEVWWPEGDNASYDDDHDRIKISGHRQWDEGAHSHEYGHHFMNCVASISDPDYCNGYCDPDDCGHCVWCRENTQDAWQEGFADYIGRVVPLTYQAEYANWAQYPMEVADLDTCSADDVIHDPNLTEGFIAACMVDIDDDDFDDHAIFPGYADQLDIGSSAILSCVDEVDPRAPMAFLTAMKDRNTSIREDLWETAMNCGFDIDEFRPVTVTGLGCSSHAVGVASPVAEIDVYWTRAHDDASGVVAYSVSITEGAPSMPDVFDDIGNVESYSSEPLAAGSYWFNIRSRDRAGRWDDDYESIGPIVIRDPEPADLAFYPRAGWDYELVPTSLEDHTSTTAHVSPTLPGYTQGTYYSITAKNFGEVATSQVIRCALWVDGIYTHWSDWGNIPGGAAFMALNVGPVEVPGGRHVLHYKLDSANRISEPSESNNYYGRQFVWEPFLLTPGSTYQRPPVCDWDAGWDKVEHGSPLFFNSDGARFTSSGWWNVVFLWGTDLRDNHDIRLHHPSTGAEDGFAGMLAHSGRGAGCLDALIVNRNVTGTQDWDVGVTNLWGEGNYDYKIGQVTSTVPSFTLGYAYAFTLGVEKYLAVKEVFVDTDELGSVSIFVETTPPTPGLHVQWRDQDYDYGKLDDADLEVTTGADGKAHLQVDVGVAGFNGLVLYRDPVDGGEAVNLVVRVKATPPDLVPYFASGWHSPVVPRPLPDGTPTSVAAPDTLHGNQAATYYNFALRNQSPGDAENLYANIYVDGHTGVALFYSSFPGWANSRFNWNSMAQTVRGGRHTLSLWIDADLAVEEIDDTNNMYGEQYVWSPYVLNPTDHMVRATPPDRTGGWTHIGSGEGKWYNCDGLRFDPGKVHWGAVAVMSGPTTNVDVRMHPPLQGAKNGFAANVAYSGWGVGQADYILVNYRDIPSRIMDVGVLSIEGSESYFVQAVRDDFLPIGEGSHGPYTMPANDILHLFPVTLDAGTYDFALRPRIGNVVDWGFCLHPADVPFVPKSTVVPGGAAWLGGLTATETFTVEIDEADTYCLAVWKVGSADVKASGEYRLNIERQATAVHEGDVLPRVTALRSVYPNPFNPRVNIAFDLAEEELAQIIIYNAAGAHVRTLLREQRPPGRYEVPWDGRDDAGQRVASGVYVARLVAGHVHQTQKMILLK